MIPQTYTKHLLCAPLWEYKDGEATIVCPPTVYNLGQRQICKPTMWKEEDFTGAMREIIDAKGRERQEWSALGGAESKF